MRPSPGLAGLLTAIVVDLVRFYPEGAAPGFSLQIQDFYVDTFRDRFFSDEAPAWFTSYLILEGVYHLPISAWMLNAILEGELSNEKGEFILKHHQIIHCCP
jgi:hypothetical protein